MNTHEDLIEEIRESRRRMSEECNHDLERYIGYLKGVHAQYSRQQEVNGLHIKEKEMEALTIADETLVDSLRKLEPAANINQSLRKLLMSRVRSELFKHTLINKNFERQYKMDFHTFRNSEQMKEPSFEVEQDYFDWELSVTKIKEMEEERQRLEKVSG